MTWFFIASCVLSAWAMLHLMGLERTQLLRDLETRLRNEPPPPPPPEPAKEPPAKSAPKTTVAKAPAPRSIAPGKSK